MTNLPTESNLGEENGTAAGRGARRYELHDDEEEGELEGNENDNFIR